MVVLKSAVLWVSFIQMGFHRLLKSSSLKGDSPEKKKKSYVGGGVTDNLILWQVGLNIN